MKRSILLFTAIAGMAYLIFSSSASGPSFSASPANRTGSGPSPTANCSGGGCHGTNDNLVTTFTLTLFEGANPATPGKYKPGVTYNCVLHGEKTGITRYGFQVTAVKTDTITVNAGTLQTGASGNKTFTHAGILGLEHNAAINSISGMTSNFTWVAPSTNVGNITFYAIINATNANNSADANDHATAKTFLLTPEVTSVSELSQNILITAYPNPAVDNVNLKFEDAEKGIYTVSVFDLAGRKMHTEKIEINSSNTSITITVSDWASGMYFAQVVKDGAQRMISVVKQ